MTDFRILKKMLFLRLQGRDDVKAGEMAKLTRTDSVTALGAMQRVLPTYRRIVNGSSDFSIVHTRIHERLEKLRQLKRALAAR